MVRNFAVFRFICVILLGMVLFFTGMVKVYGLSGYFQIPSDLSLRLNEFSLADEYIVVPFLISRQTYDDLFGSNRQDRLGFRFHLDGVENRYDAIRIVDLVADQSGLVRSLKPASDGKWRMEWYRLSSLDRFVLFDAQQLPLGSDQSRLIGLKVYAGTLALTHRQRSSIPVSYRFFDDTRTYERASFSIRLEWIPYARQTLYPSSSVESYTQSGTLTCEFASVQNALALLGIVTDERTDLIPRFPQGDTKDPTLDPREVFLGEYGFGVSVPQAFHVTAGPLGGYGVHLDRSFLEKVVFPFAPAAQLQPFSLAVLDHALSFNVPVIVQGVFFDRDGNPHGGAALRLNLEDHRGMVVGEHTFTIFGKTDDGLYRIKDPFKRNFLTLSSDAVKRSVELFGQYGAGKNMILMLPHEVPTLASTYLLQGTDGTLREVSE